MKTKRETVGVTVLATQPCLGGEWFPENLVDAIAWLNELLEEMPPAYRNKATISVGSEMEWDWHHPTLEIRYCRPESDAEMNGRLRKRQQAKEYEKDHELATLKRLQEKYKDVKA